MWARRCGVPPRWPSRIKVLIQSFVTAAIGFAVFQYMSGADLGYLNLKDPRSEQVLCVSDWPLRHEASTWWQLKFWQEWMSYRIDMDAYINEHQCSGKTNVEGLQCSAVQAPLYQMGRHLGIPLGLDYNWKNDAIEIYGHLFLWMTFCMWVLVTVHDLALLTVRNHDYVYDLREIRTNFPCWRALYTLIGFRAWRRMLCGRGCKPGRSHCCEGPGKVFAILLAPLWCAWAILVFILIILPVVSLFFICYPIRLSRALIFLNSLATAIFGLCLALHSLAFVCSAETRQLYAVTWSMPTDTGSTCICGCIYRLSIARCWGLLGIGAGVAYKSIALAFRCLKGLRHSNWSNLISVLFAVPLGVYEVSWTKPDGKPIQYRKPGEPVQGELAFDPFALMDEQLNSGSTTLELVPTAVDPRGWGVEEVARYFQSLGLSHYRDAVRRERVDGAALLELLQRRDGLEQLGVASEKDARRIRARLPRAASGNSASPVPQSPRHLAGPVSGSSSEKLSDRDYVGCCGFPCRQGENSRRRQTSSDSEQDGDMETVEAGRAQETQEGEGPAADEPERPIHL